MPYPAASASSFSRASAVTDWEKLYQLEYSGSNAAAGTCAGLFPDTSAIHAAASRTASAQNLARVSTRTRTSYKRIGASGTVKNSNPPRHSNDLKLCPALNFTSRNTSEQASVALLPELASSSVKSGME